MKRLVFATLFTVLLLALTACGFYLSPTNHETNMPEAGIFIDLPLDYADDSTDLQEDNENLHPFAIALENFITDAEGEIRSFLVDVDGNNTKGVLVVDLSGFPHGTLFYIYDGTMNQTDVGPQDAGFVSDVTAKGRLVNIIADGGQRSYTLFEIENGRLVEYIMLLIDRHGRDDVNDTYYFLPYIMRDSNGQIHWENRIQISQEEFNNIRIRYGLDNLRGPWWEAEDETAEILQMVVSAESPVE